MASPQERRMVVIPVRFHRFTQKLAKYWSLYITYVAFGPLVLLVMVTAGLWKYYFTYLENKLFSLVKFLSVREESVFCIVICWHLLVQPPKYQINALQKPQLQQSNRNVGVRSFFWIRVLYYNSFCQGRKRFLHYDLVTLVCPPEYPIDAPCKSGRFAAIKQKFGGWIIFFIPGFHQSGAQWHFDQQLHRVPVQSDFWIKEMNTCCTFTNSMSFGTSVLRSCRRSDKLSSPN